jgi:hypothetical protein
MNKECVKEAYTEHVSLSIKSVPENNVTKLLMHNVEIAHTVVLLV